MFIGNLYLNASADKELFYVTSKSGSKRYHLLNIGFDKFFGDEKGGATVFNLTLPFFSISIGWVFKN